MTEPDLAIYRSRPFVVVVTAGRTGSTLLQGILNSIPGYLVRGENYGFMMGLYSSYLSLQQTALFPAGSPRHAWFGADEVDAAQFAKDVASTTARQLLGKAASTEYRALGFKEVRWTPRVQHSSLWGYLEFIETVFPLSRFILLTRDIDETMKSGFWTERDVPSLRHSIESLNILVRLAPVQQRFEIDYANLKEGDVRLAQLFDFLGEPYPERVGEVLKLPHSVWA